MKIILFGAGENLIEFFQVKRFLWNVKIVGIVDNDSKKWGNILSFRYIRGAWEIMSPEALKKYSYDKVVITTHYNEIRNQLIEMYGISEEEILDLKKLDRLENTISYIGHSIKCLSRKVKKNRNGSLNHPVYVITSPFPEGFRHQGLGQMENQVLSHSIYAVERGWIPVVDMKNYSSMYQEKDESGKINTWEKYYEQPAGYSLDDLSEARKIIYSIDTRWIDDNYKMNTELRKAFYAKYIFVREDLKKEINEEWERLTGGKKRILGCVCRGTDVIGLNWKNNYASVDTIISYLKDVKSDYEKIYLATEDQDMYERMMNQFGDDIIAYSQQRYTMKKDKYLFEYEDKRKNARYLRGKEYLFVLEMLSRCVAVTGMLGTAVSIACMKNPNLKVVQIPDKYCAEYVGGKI